MFVVSVKTGKKRMILVLAAVLVILTAALAAGKLLGGAQAAQSLPAGETNEQRLAFLQGYGWEADTEAVEVRGRRRLPEIQRGAKGAGHGFGTIRRKDLPPMDL